MKKMGIERAGRHLAKATRLHALVDGERLLRHIRGGGLGLLLLDLVGLDVSDGLLLGLRHDVWWCVGSLSARSSTADAVSQAVS